MAVSLWHVPGRGSGTFEFSTGSQALFELACSLNLPAKKRMKESANKRKSGALFSAALKSMLWKFMCVSGAVAK